MSEDYTHSFQLQYPPYIASRRYKDLEITFLLDLHKFEKYEYC